MKLLSLTLLLFYVEVCYGHGRLISPPGRSTMWRYGYNTPVNTNDNQLSCGGFGVQYYKNSGKCGLCGDPWDGKRENEAGGLYATGAISGVYNQGDVITIKIEVTVNHGGWFEFRLCPNNNPERKATEDCLNSNLLELTTGGTQYQLSAARGTGVFPVNLKLPRTLTCNQCVLQWKWKTASNVHCQGSTCCRGCGQQEWFYGCADISIKPSAGASNQNYFHFGNQNMQGPLTTLFKRQPTERTPIYPNNFPDSFVPINVGGPYNSGKGSLPQNIIPFGVNRQANRKPQS